MRKALILLGLLLVGLRLLPKTNLTVTFFDVGQGDSILIELPGSGSMLIDGGGGFGDWNLGKRELYLELARKGILKLNDMVLTHPDMDHGGGLVGILDQISVNSLWISNAFLKEKKKSPLLESILNVAKNKAVTVSSLTKETEVGNSLASVRLLATNSISMKENDRSVVVLVNYRGCKILLTGDIEAAGEAWLLKRDLPEITLLKVAHHGSRTSSSTEFLKKIHPAVGVISVGRGNRYRHPNVETLEKLARLRTETFRTDFHGYVEFTFSSDKTYRCRTALGGCGGGLCQ